ncbi:MAG: hypothetical protein WC224_02925 [Sphaerochaetaceae bacterium]
MGKKAFLVFVAAVLLVPVLFGQRILFSDIIPLRGHIDIEEKFELELQQAEYFRFTKDLAGTTHEIASYKFMSNSPSVIYQMKLSPAFATSLGEGIFAFRNIRPASSDLEGAPIPFKISVATITRDSVATSEEFKAFQKAIGTQQGSQSVENGTISVTFPSENEGYDFDGFSSGSYEASIAVEVSAD